jgi:hypothetical protein
MRTEKTNYYLTNVSDTRINYSYLQNKQNDEVSGFEADIGFNYILKDTSKTPKLKIGGVIRNIGSLRAKSFGDTFNNYTFSSVGLPDLNLTVAEENNSIKITLPTVFSLYADYKIKAKFYTAVYTQIRLVNPNNDYTIIPQNILSITLVTQQKVLTFTLLG